MAGRRLAGLPPIPSRASVKHQHSELNLPQIFPFATFYIRESTFYFSLFSFSFVKYRSFPRLFRFPFEKVSIKVDRFSYSGRSRKIYTWQLTRERKSRGSIGRKPVVERLSTFSRFNRVYSVIRAGR